MFLYMPFWRRASAAQLRTRPLGAPPGALTMLTARTPRSTGLEPAPDRARQTRPVVVATLEAPLVDEAARLAVDSAVETGQPLLVVNAVESDPRPVRARARLRLRRAARRRGVAARAGRARPHARRPRRALLSALAAPRRRTARVRGRARQRAARRWPRSDAHSGAGATGARAARSAKGRPASCGSRPTDLLPSRRPVRNSVVEEAIA